MRQPLRYTAFLWPRVADFCGAIFGHVWLGYFGHVWLTNVVAFSTAYSALWPDREPSRIGHVWPDFRAFFCPRVADFQRDCLAPNWPHVADLRSRLFRRLSGHWRRLLLVACRLIGNQDGHNQYDQAQEYQCHSAHCSIEILLFGHFCVLLFDLPEYRPDQNRQGYRCPGDPINCERRVSGAPDFLSIHFRPPVDIESGRRQAADQYRQCAPAIPPLARRPNPVALSFWVVVHLCPCGNWNWQWTDSFFFLPSEYLRLISIKHAVKIAINVIAHHQQGDNSDKAERDNE